MKQEKTEEENNEMKGGEKTNYEFIIQIAIIAILALFLVYNAGKIYSVTDNVIASDSSSGILPSVSASEIIPKGVPEVYGKALGVSFDDVTASNPGLADATIQKLATYEDKQLSVEQMERYKKIGGSISCEYCCGAEAIIFSNGERACGCAHSYAMRGLAKYLLINNPDMSDYDILAELGKWKVLFFPGVHEQKAQVLEANGIDSTDYVNLASNKYRGIEQGKTSGGSMVGGC